MEHKLSVMIVDDHEMVRRGLVGYIQFEDDMDIVAEAANGEEAIKLCARHQPDVILMDLIMEPVDGITATKEIKKDFPDTQIIVLTSFVDEEQILPALEAGALSYLLKTAKADEIVKAIRLAAQQQAVIEPRVASTMLNQIRGKTKMPHLTLTKRELEVLSLIGEGKTNQEIADELFIGIKTVKTHVSNILSKLGVDDRTQAAIYANRHGLTAE